MLQSASARLRRDPDKPTDPSATGETGETGFSRRRALMLCILAMPLLVVVYLIVLWASTPSTIGKELRIDEFTTMVRQGQVASATVLEADGRIVGSFVDGKYTVAFGNATVFARLLDVLESGNVATKVDQQSFKRLLVPVTHLLPPFIIIDGMLIIFLLFGSAGEGILRFARSGAQKVNAADRKTTFAELAGVDEAIEELAEVRDYLATPERFTALGATIPKGILLTGPPGCGKTLLARALAGEADVPFFSMSGSQFVEIFVGVGASRIRDFFRVTKAAAPCIAFIDELDALGRARSNHAFGGQDEREAALNQLLVEMDGFEPGSGVVVLAATNRPDILDSALLRPGRFDRRVAMERPDVRGRLAILAIHTRGKPLGSQVDLELVARHTAGFSGADLANVVNEAALLAARRGHSVIDATHFTEAVERAVAGPETRSRVLSSEDRHRIAYHEAGHVVVSCALSGAESVTKVSIVARGHTGGLTWLVPAGDQVTVTKGQLLDRLAAMLGGRGAEELVTGEVSTGAATDLQAAAGLARRMVAELGMAEALGVFYAGPPAGNVTSSQSEHLAARVDAEVQVLLDSANQRARSVLERHHKVLDDVASALMRDETLEGEEFERLVAPLDMSSTTPALRCEPDSAAASSGLPQDVAESVDCVDDARAKRL